MNSYFTTLALSLFLIFTFQHLTAQIPTNGLVGYYMLDGNPADSSQMGNHGTIVGQVTPTTNRFGETDKALLFSGGYIDAGNPISYQFADSMSIATWINPTSISDWSCIASKWDWYGGGYYLGIDPAANTLRWNLGYPHNPVNASPILINEWKHIVVTFNGDTTYIYEDGFLVKAFPLQFSISNTPASLFIATQWDGPSYSFNGVMDDVLIYNRELTPKEVKDIYNDVSTEVKDILPEHAVSIYPNPAINSFSIQHDLKSPVALKIYDVSGRLQLQQNNVISGQPIPIDKLNKGFYIVGYFLENEFIGSAKLVKE